MRIPTASLSRIARNARRVAALAAAGLTLGLLGQILSAGAAVFLTPEWWLFHNSEVHWFDWLAPTALVFGFLGRMSRRFKLLAGSAVVLLLVQYVTAGLRASPNLHAGAALHPLGAFLLSWTAVELTRRAWLEMRA